ncbi:unnamed protein product [Sympodiomycopsis kandeliae]
MAPSATPTSNGAGTGASDTTFASSSKVTSFGATAAVSPSTSIDYASYLSNAAKHRPVAPIRSLFPLEEIPGMLSLLAGKPNPETFPFESITVNLKPNPETQKSEEIKIQGDDLYLALQYGATAGLPRLTKWLSNMQSNVHKRAVDNKIWQISLGVGSQDSLNKSFEALINPGDVFLCETPAYAGILPCLGSVHADVVAVESDDQGVSAEYLSRLLANWKVDPATATKPMPKVLYTTPTGANPSGTTSSEERKLAILNLSRKYNFLIIEDDPYYFLNFEGLGEDPVTRPRPASYFCLDGQTTSDIGGPGRVLRFDSFSKILSGGMRLGFMTAHPTFITAVDHATASANLQTSGVAQAVALAAFERWGHEGFLQHCDRVSQFYKERRDRFESMARKVLGGNSSRGAVAEWITPTAGMFLWLKLILPPVESSKEGDSYTLISKEAKEAGVLAVPGVGFMPDARKSCYVRTSFSLIPEADFEEAFTRLRRVVEEKWQKEGLKLPGSA